MERTEKQKEAQILIAKIAQIMMEHDIPYILIVAVDNYGMARCNIDPEPLKLLISDVVKQINAGNIVRSPVSDPNNN